MYFYTRNKFTYGNSMSCIIKMLSNFKNSKLKRFCYYLYKAKKNNLFLHKDFSNVFLMLLQTSLLKVT